MKYCRRCVYPENHPLGLVLDDQGVCSGCRVHEEKDQLDWNDKFQKLKTIVGQYRVKSRTINDCIVPVSGARDSYFIVHVVKNLLGMNPLLVTYNKHYNTEAGHRNLAYLKTTFGVPLFTLTVNPERVKRITRNTLNIFGSIYWHCLAGQTGFPVQTAYRFRVPLIIWGCHQGIDQVGMYSHTDEVEMTRKYRKEHDLMHYEAEDLVENTELGVDDLEAFFYPHDKEIESVGIRGIYLNNYIRWDSKKQHESMIKDYGYETMLQRSTFDTYNDIDCFHYSGPHDYIKYVKHGYRKISDHVSREIRLGRLSREHGIQLVNSYEVVELFDMSTFSKWIGMTSREIEREIEKHRNSRIWRAGTSRNWIKNFSLEARHDLSDSVTTQSIVSTLNWNADSRRVRSTESKEYKLLARGWVKEH